MMHLKHKHVLIDVKESSASGNAKQSQIDAYRRNVSEFTPARTSYELNRDFLVWCSLDLQPFNFVAKPGMQYFVENFFK